MERHYKHLTDDEVALALAVKPYCESGELDKDDSAGVYLLINECGKAKEMLEYLNSNKNLTREEIMEKAYQLTLE